MKILFFTASWCAPCRKVKPIVKEIAEEYDIDVDELDVTLHVKTAQIFNVISTPTLVVIDNDGLEVNRVTGAKPKSDLVEALNIVPAPEWEDKTPKPAKGILTTDQMKVQGGLK